MALQNEIISKGAHIFSPYAHKVFLTHNSETFLWAVLEEFTGEWVSDHQNERLEGLEGKL